MKTVTALVLTLLILPSVLWSGILVAIAPHTDMIDNIEHEDTIRYWFPEYTSEGQYNYIPCYSRNVLRLDITDEDYIKSSEQNPIRMYSKVNDYESYITPDNEYVRKVAESLQELIDMQGYEYTEAQIAVAVLIFVRSAITYELDEIQYGMEGYVAFPTETLYSCRGDCEDVAILYVSIARAMGLDAVLVHFPQHVAVGVKLDNRKGDLEGYSLMECTSDYKDRIWPDKEGGEIMEYSKPKVIFDSANQMWRKRLHDYLGWIHPRI